MSQPSHRAVARINKRARAHYPKVSKPFPLDQLYLLGKLSDDGPSLIVPAQKAEATLGVLQGVTQNAGEPFQLLCDIAGPGLTKGRVYTCTVDIVDDQIGFRTTDDRGYPCFYGSGHFTEAPVPLPRRPRIRFMAASNDAIPIRFKRVHGDDIDDFDTAGDIERSHASRKPNSVFDGPDDAPAGVNYVAVAIALTAYLVIAAAAAGAVFGLYSVWQAASPWLTDLFHFNPDVN